MVSRPTTKRFSGHCFLGLWLAVALLPMTPGAAADSGEPARPGLSPAKHLRDAVVTRWTVEDGLPTDTLTNVIQAADGYVWISSFNGLIRFDGLGFKVFDKKTVDVFQTSGFHALVEDDAGTLWIGGQADGVIRYRGGAFERLPGTEDFRHTVRSILIDAEGTAWIGTGEAGVYRYRDGGLSAVDHPALRDVTVRDVFQDPDGAIWFATEGHGLVRQGAGVYTVYDVTSGLASDAVTHICPAAGGGLWVGTEDGLSRVGAEGIETFDALAGTEIYRLRLDDHGNLWIAAEQGLIRRNGSSGDLERLESFDGEPLRGVTAVAFDHEGSVWVASYLSGLYRLNEGKFQNFNAGNGLSSARVNSLYQTAAGDVLVGGDGGRIDVIRNGSAGAWESGAALPDVRVRGFLEDRRGRLWIASYAGLARIADGEVTWYTTANGLATNQVRDVFEDRTGRIWIGTRNAGLLEVLEGGGFRAVDRSSGLSSDFILSIAEGPDGELVLGTHEGLNVLHPDGSIASWGVADGVPGGIVFSTLIDDDGALWLATNGGLARFSSGAFRSLTAGAGLPAESVFDLVRDGRGSVWLSSNEGVIRLARQQLTDFMNGELTAVDAVVFDARDGMASRSCTGAAKILKTSDGRLWFPTLGGVSVLDPEHLPVNRMAPPVYVEAIFADGEAVDAAGHGGVVELEPGSRTFRFRFAALSLLAPSKTEVRYRLVGFDDGWIEAGGEREVRYTNLPHGDYAFRVIAANNDGVWNHDGATLAFRIKPHVWQMPIFIAAAVLLAGTLVRVLYVWRVRAVQARNLRLEEIVASQRRTQASNRRLIEELETKNAELERFTYTVSHDLKSPLVTIRGFLGMARRDLASGELERLPHDLGRIDSASKTMARLLDELLELSRIGRVIGPTEEVALTDLAHEAAALIAGSLGEASVEIAPDLPRVAGDRARLLEVLQNLLENAVKFVGDQPAPRVEVGVRYAGGETVVYVRDNGAGIEPQYHDKIFGLFERLDAATAGTGVGLTLVKRIIEVHGGRVWVESEGAGKGSTFCFTLPSAPAGAGQEPAA